MRLVLKDTVYNIVVLMVDSSDHVTGKGGLTLTITASKDGGTLGAITPTTTELGDGLYKLILNTGHTDTLGDLVLHVTGSGADPTDVMMQIVGFDPEIQMAYETGGNVASVKAKTDNLPSTPAGVGDQMGLSDGAISSAKLATGALTSSVFATGAITGSAIAAGAIGATQAPNLDAAISTRATPAQILSDATPFAGADIESIKDQTDLLPASPAAVGSQMTLQTGAITSGSFGAGAITATVAPNLDAAVSTRAAESAGNLSAVKAKTDNLPALPAAQGDVMALSSTYDAAKTAASQTSVTSVASDVGTIKNTDLPAVKSTVDSLYNTSVPAVKSDTATIMAKTNLIGASIALETGGNLASVKAKTDNLPGSPAATGDAMTLTGTYDAAKVASSATQVTTLQGDVTIIKGTDLPAVKSDTAAIKAKTDNLPGAPAATGDAMTLTAAYDAAKTAASQTSVTDLDTDLTYLRRALTNKKRWDSVNSRWIIYADDDATPLYYLKVYNPADGNVVLGANSIAHGDKIA